MAAFRIHEFRMVPNSAAIAQKLANPADRLVLRMAGVRYAGGRPLSHAVYHLPSEIGARLAPELLSEEALIPQLEELAGIRVADARQSFSASRADRTAARRLRVTPGAPVLVVETLYSTRGAGLSSSWDAVLKTSTTTPAGARDEAGCCSIARRLPPDATAVVSGRGRLPRVLDAW
jgi:hypothetical protein